jgi:hypothetical protein
MKILVVSGRRKADFEMLLATPTTIEFNFSRFNENLKITVYFPTTVTFSVLADALVEI